MVSPIGSRTQPYAAIPICVEPAGLCKSHGLYVNRRGGRDPFGPAGPVAAISTHTSQTTPYAPICVFPPGAPGGRGRRGSPPVAPTALARNGAARGARLPRGHDPVAGGTELRLER